MVRRFTLLFALSALAVGIAVAPRHLVSRTQTDPDFTHFESSHVHPAVLTPDGTRLLVVSTPDNHLTVFDLTTPTPERIAEIPVGLEPVSVAARSNTEAWVVNHLSDNVSIVDLTTKHVKATLRVGDEPSDIVFAGPSEHAYVSVSQEDAIRVYDSTTLGLVTTIPVAGRMPRALAKNAAGTLVFAAIFNAGNRTTVLTAAEVADSIPDDPDFPRDINNKHGHIAPPDVGGIVQYLAFGGEGAGWYDEYGKLWSSKVKYTMPDADVSEINTTTNTVSRNFSGLGSVNYNVAVAPDGRLVSVGTEGRNQLRFEPKLRGYLVDTRISYVTPAGTLSQRLLNPHINYTVTPGPQAEVDSALGIPTAVAFSSNNQRVYVTAFSNNRLAVLNPGAGANQILARVPTIRGPSGMVLDEPRGRIYVVGRFHNQLQTLSSDSLVSLHVTRIGFDPTPDAIVNGRKFFYGGSTSGHGDQACASCHIFGDMDNLAWDLGDPFAEYIDPPVSNPLGLEGFDPQKGPMTTQTLRGMTNTEPLHWRGDRVNLSAFNGAFVSLMGRSAQLPDSEMTAFNDFAMPLANPPNPHRFLDNTLPDYAGAPSPADGETFFLNTPISGSNRCVDCHSLPAGTNRVMVPDSLLFEDQDLKVPQLRNLYRKTGFTDETGASSKRGTGFTHDGAIDNLFNFLRLPQFSFNPDTGIAHPARRDVAAFLMAFPTGTAPAVGVQVTFDGASNPEGASRVDTLRSQFAAGNIDVIAKGRVGTQPRGWEYLGGDAWQPDKASASNLTTAQLLALATDPAHAVTVTGVPRGSGHRMGNDRDRDSYRDGDELDAGSLSGDPLSTPLNVAVGDGVEGARNGLERVSPNPFKQRAEVLFTLARAAAVDVVVYDVLGREVRDLAHGRRFEAGRWSVEWNGRRNDGGEAGVGMYFVRMRTETGTWVRPLVRIR
ncbi:MAG TPA: beta-propeller fold lactonase family protein [Candidatus Limnocylindria bacterium]|nr:beta-propeller fold lactonase family protein [Candidatus Limnocylindria bacterium]